MASRRHCGTLIGLLAAASLTAAAGTESPALSPPEQTLEILDVGQLYKMQMETGEIVYLSRDRRFVFRGVMTDLWKGEAIGLEPVTPRINMHRNGIDIERISFAVGAGDQDVVVWLAPECEGCVAVVQAMLLEQSIKANRYRVVLLSSTTEGDRATRLIWCARDQEEALRAVFVNGTVPRTKRHPGEACDQFGLLSAEQAALAFGIAQLPLLVKGDGTAIVGTEQVLATLESK